MSMTFQDVIDIEVEPGRGVMARLDETGDTKVTWSRDNTAEIAIARAAFDSAKGQGMAAYRTRSDGSKGEVIGAFDPTAERIILAPALRGG
jgi:hypothetical protein